MDVERSMNLSFDGHMWFGPRWSSSCDPDMHSHVETGLGRAWFGSSILGMSWTVDLDGHMWFGPRWSSSVYDDMSKGKFATDNVSRIETSCDTVSSHVHLG